MLSLLQSSRHVLFLWSDIWEENGMCGEDFCVTGYSGINTTPTLTLAPQ